MAWSLQQQGHHAYVDDYVLCERTFLAGPKAFNDFISLADTLELNLALDKWNSPAIWLQWLGFSISSKDLMIRVMDTLVEDCKLRISMSSKGDAHIDGPWAKVNELDLCRVQAHQGTGGPGHMKSDRRTHRGTFPYNPGL